MAQYNVVSQSQSEQQQQVLTLREHLLSAVCHLMPVSAAAAYYLPFAACYVPQNMLLAICCLLPSAWYLPPGFLSAAA